ncbi:MAG: S-methyl-5-thioribose-1-phosphate isomerase [Bdellovibrionales bacterium GWA2_49_15]|nr:MAG: S-methyl-5-thioribose-1-phosphate isomerase [Bdellovibrionales bacterium GWA2_49_15]
MNPSMPKSVSYEDRCLIFLDQTQLPNDVVFEEQTSIEQVWHSIKMLKVRGAPAIGVAGAYGLFLGARNLLSKTPKISAENFILELNKIADYLDSSRPTAVNLKWALKRMLKSANKNASKNVHEICNLLEHEAIRIHEEDKKLCRKIGENGLPLIKNGMGILTHCNAGALAVSELGTALAPIYLAHEKGIKLKVYSDETRPLLQGARLTSWELMQSGVDVTLITDNMAAHIMSQGHIQMAIVGADRVASNGDVANKIGTLGVAILAKYFNIPFYVACPFSTIDLKTPTGKEIEIEERGAEEVCHFGGRRTAPEKIKVRNPAFDVTPHHLVTGLITERGLLPYPYAEKIMELYRDA